MGVVAIDHTADWAIRVTAPSAADLFRRSALGLYHLAGMRLASRSRRAHQLQVEGVDWESVLVAWLNELLFLKEQRNEAFPEIEVVAVDQRHLDVLLRGGHVAAWTRDIKAVTFHNLRVVTGPDVWQATLVFDV
jgi:protein archease